MGLSSAVEWEGLTKLILDLQEKIPGNCQRELESMTNELFDDTLLRYIENLSGASPSTDSDPLPVGIQTGDMISHAWSDSRVINQFAFEIKNESEHAGWIEDGTAKMVARRPLGDAVDILEQQMDVKLDDVLVHIFEG